MKQSQTTKTVKSLTAKTIATIMLMSLLILSAQQASAASQNSQAARRQERQLERIYRRHDRKMDLRASVLGLRPDELRERLRTESFRHITKKAGFKNEVAFHTAVVGKLKGELRERGWNDQKINSFVSERSRRYEV